MSSYEDRFGYDDESIKGLTFYEPLSPGADARLTQLLEQDDRSPEELEEIKQILASRKVKAKVSPRADERMRAYLATKTTTRLDGVSEAELARRVLALTGGVPEGTSDSALVALAVSRLS